MNLVIPPHHYYNILFSTFLFWFKQPLEPVYKNHSVSTIHNLVPPPLLPALLQHVSMRGFLGCFGCVKRRKRPKGGNKNASSSSGAHSYGSYVPLDSDANQKLDWNEKRQEGSADLIREGRDKPKESAAAKIKKKVSFNLNHRTYEPILNDEEETAASSLEYLSFEDDASQPSPFPPNHRYANWAAYEDDDEIESEDIDEDEEELDFEEDDFAEEEFDPEYSRARKAVEAEPTQIVRRRGEFASSVLNPVQNLSQWKEVKATSRQQLRIQKENMMMKHDEMPSSQLKKSDSLPSSEVAVDASLSTWLSSSRSC